MDVKGTSFSCGVSMTRYPSSSGHRGCDWYENGACTEPRACLKNGGKCNGGTIDCFYWEITK